MSKTVNLHYSGMIAQISYINTGLIDNYVDLKILRGSARYTKRI